LIGYKSDTLKLAFLGMTSSLSMPLLAGSLDSSSGPADSGIDFQKNPTKIFNRIL
jgi:hypothetical protein